MCENKNIIKYIKNKNICTSCKRYVLCNKKNIHIRSQYSPENTVRKNVNATIQIYIYFCDFDVKNI